MYLSNPVIGYHREYNIDLMVMQSFIEFGNIGIALVAYFYLVKFKDLKISGTISLTTLVTFPSLSVAE